MKHIVTDIQRFCMHDGPGIRTTVFLKGCPLRCFWCHNPETQSHLPQLMYHAAKCMGCGACSDCKSGVHSQESGIHRLKWDNCLGCKRCIERCPTGALSFAGTEMESEEIVAVACKDKAFYGSDGGITVSGGEPMLFPAACIDLLTCAKKQGLTTAVETCGYFPKGWVAPLCQVTDTLLWDIKDTDPLRHQKNTGVSNDLILENLREADRYGVPIVLRCVLLKGITLENTHLRRVAELFSSLEHGVRVDLLPCHALGNAKKIAIGEEEIDLHRFEVSREELLAARRKQDLYLEK